MCSWNRNIYSTWRFLKTNHYILDEKYLTIRNVWPIPPRLLCSHLHKSIWFSQSPENFFPTHSCCDRIPLSGNLLSFFLLLIGVIWTYPNHYEKNNEYGYPEYFHLPISQISIWLIYFIFLCLKIVKVPWRFVKETREKLWTAIN